MVSIGAFLGIVGATDCGRLSRHVDNDPSHASQSMQGYLISTADNFLVLLRLNHLSAQCAQKGHSDRDPDHFAESGNESLLEGVHQKRISSPLGTLQEAGKARPVRRLFVLLIFGIAIDTSRPARRN
jgi:hypothetical protein